MRIEGINTLEDQCEGLQLFCFIKRGGKFIFVKKNLCESKQGSNKVL